MDFEEFREKLKEDLAERLYDRTGDDFAITSSSVAKLQNAGYEGISVRKEGEAVGVNLDVASFYKDIESGKIDYDTALAKITDVAYRGFEEAPVFNVSELSNYDIMKEHLSMQVVATERNAEMLESIPHKEIEDMSVVCRFIVSTDKEGIGSILVTNQLLQNMNVTEEQLFADAQKYAPDLRPSEIRGMADILAEMMGVDVSELENQFGGAMGQPEIPMYVATTQDKTNGAGIIAYPGFMEMAAEKLGGDFFLLPSSVHEVILIPDRPDMKYSELENMVKEVNATQVDERDQLSDHVYHYDAKERVFELAEKFDARKKERTAEKQAEKDSVLKDLSDKKKEVADTPKVKTDKALKKDAVAL
ncbi:MAG: DUF5688 family protein [Lachnospiraceae bacterium]|nr:DUF5688 family protein [Lachnospiraceae bacterium]